MQTYPNPEPTACLCECQMCVICGPHHQEVHPEAPCISEWDDESLDVHVFTLAKGMTQEQREWFVMCLDYTRRYGIEIQLDYFDSVCLQALNPQA